MRFGVSVRTRLVVGGCLLALVGSAHALAQEQAVVLKGGLLHSLTGEPVAQAVVTLEEMKREAKSAADGSYTFDNVPPGRYHLWVRADGFVPEHHEVTVPVGGATIDVAVAPELHYSEVISVGPEPRSQFESYQPTSVLAGQDLARQRSRIAATGTTSSRATRWVRNSRTTRLRSRSWPDTAPQAA